MIIEPLPPKAVQDKFVKLVQKSESILKVEQRLGYLGLKPDINQVFDLDRLWSKPIFFKQAIKIISDLVSGLTKNFDIIGGITSSVGSFGTVPLAAVLAFEMNKDLISFSEMGFGQYYMAPLSYDKREFMHTKKILLLKDVIMGGRSLKQVGSIIAKFGGHISLIIALIDFGLVDNIEIEGVSEETILFRLLLGPNFQELGGGG